MRTQNNADRPNGHDRRHGVTDDEERCPFCLSPIAPSAARTVKQRILAEEKRLLGRLETAMRQQFAKEKAQAEAQARAAIERARKDAAKVAEAKLKMIREGQAGAIATAVEAERIKSGKTVADAVAAAKIEHAAEKARLEAALSLLQKKVAARPAHQIGDGPETDLFDVIRAAFPGDTVTRVRRGTRGPDVLLDVALPSGEVAGRVCLDSKAISRWSNRLPVKLREDQLSTKSDFALLVSNTFPAGANELHLQDGVLVVSPGRVVAVVTFLRQQIITNYRLKLSIEQREEKGDKLLAYLTTEATEYFARWAKATDDLIGLEANELDIQTGIHRKRGEMLRALQRTHEQLTGTIDRIVGNNDYPELEVAK